LKVYPDAMYGTFFFSFGQQLIFFRGRTDKLPEFGRSNCWYESDLPSVCLLISKCNTTHFVSVLAVGGDILLQLSLHLVLLSSIFLRGRVPLS